MADQPAFQLVLTTASSDEQARALAHGLVERRLAACVNIVGPACSVYRWEGRVVQEDERILLIKSEAGRFEALAAAIRELHTYDVPEVIALPIRAGDPRYMDWLAGCLEP